MASRSALPPRSQPRCRRRQFNSGVLARDGSGDEQAEAEFRRVEGDEVAVALRPPARGKVVAETVHCPLLGRRAAISHCVVAWGSARFPAVRVVLSARSGPRVVRAVFGVSCVGLQHCVQAAVQAVSVGALGRTHPRQLRHWPSCLGVAKSSSMEGSSSGTGRSVRHSHPSAALTRTSGGRAGSGQQARNHSTVDESWCARASCAIASTR